MTFPNKTLLFIAMVLTMSTATVEHLFSDMKQIKDHFAIDFYYLVHFEN